MPYSQRELKELADKTDNDPTLLAATKIPGAAELNDEGEVATKYHPVTLPDGESYVRRTDSRLEWQDYAFEMVMSDGTRHDFLFTAKDDGDAQKKVRERVAATQHAEGSYKLSRLERPRELSVGTLTGLATVDEKTAEPSKATSPNEKTVEVKTTKKG